MGLRSKIFLSSLAAVTGLGLTVLWLLQLQTQANFADYRRANLAMEANSLAVQLSQSYAQEQNWRGVLRDAWRWPSMFPPDPSQAPRERLSAELRRPPPPGPPRHQRPAQLEREFMLFDQDKQPISRGNWPPEELLWSAVDYDGKPVGWLAYRDPGDAPHPLDQRFAEQQQRSAWILALSGLLLAGLSAWLLSGQLLQRLKLLVAAATQVQAGDLAVQLGNKPKDEIGELMSAFENMAAALADSQQRQDEWLADIAHELRTPLAVLRGELESLIDGVRRVSPSALNSLHEEVQHLNKLVDDLHLLSSAQNQALQLQTSNIALADFIRTTLAQHEAEFAAAGITVEMRINPHIQLHADPRRLRQVLDNLLQNARRYAANETLIINAKESSIAVILDVIDHGPGVDEHHLPRLFDRLYRVDNSRNKDSGGSGLGLAICRSIVEAHDGRIEALAVTPHGLDIRMHWPKKP